MTWKRVLIVALLAIVTVLAAFFISTALLTRWYIFTETHGDGQVSLSIVGGSAIVSLLCGLVTLGAALSVGRRSD
jgi:hypothetical protein